jgi:hypothetical protein
MKLWISIEDINKLRTPLIIKDICPICWKDVFSNNKHHKWKWDMVHLKCKWELEMNINT